MEDNSTMETMEATPCYEVVVQSRPIRLRPVQKMTLQCAYCDEEVRGDAVVAVLSTVQSIPRTVFTEWTRPRVSICRDGILIGTYELDPNDVRRLGAGEERIVWTPPVEHAWQQNEFDFDTALELSTDDEMDGYMYVSFTHLRRGAVPVMLDSPDPPVSLVQNAAVPTGLGSFIWRANM